MDKFQVVLSLRFPRGLEARGAQGHCSMGQYRGGTAWNSDLLGSQWGLCRGLGLTQWLEGAGGEGAGTSSVGKMPLA